MAPATEGPHTLGGSGPRQPRKQAARPRPDRTRLESKVVAEEDGSRQDVVVATGTDTKTQERRSPWWDHRPAGPASSRYKMCRRTRRRTRPRLRTEEPSRSRNKTSTKANSNRNYKPTDRPARLSPRPLRNPGIGLAAALMVAPDGVSGSARPFTHGWGEMTDSAPRWIFTPVHFTSTGWVNHRPLTSSWPIKGRVDLHSYGCTPRSRAPSHSGRSGRASGATPAAVRVDPEVLPGFGVGASLEMQAQSGESVHSCSSIAAMR